MGYVLYRVLVGICMFVCKQKQALEVHVIVGIMRMRDKYYMHSRYEADSIS